MMHESKLSKGCFCSDFQLDLVFVLSHVIYFVKTSVILPGVLTVASGTGLHVCIFLKERTRAVNSYILGKILQYTLK